MERYTSYKDSCILWIGEIPEHWEVRHLSQVSYEHYISNKEVHHQNLLSLSYGRIIRKDINTTEGLLPASFDTYHMVKDGIIVFRFTDLQNDHKSLRVGLVKEEGIISPAYVCVQCENVLPEFLYLQLHTFDLRKVFYSMGDGMRQTLSYSDIKDMDVFVPSMEEQQRIVTFFQSFDKQISLQTLQLEKLEQLKKACLKKMIA
jgi:restriction endonuclease S subunit